MMAFVFAHIASCISGDNSFQLYQLYRPRERMSKENRRKLPENRGFFKTAGFFERGRFRGAMRMGRRAARIKPSIYKYTVFADFPIKNRGFSKLLWQTAHAHCSGACCRRGRKQAKAPGHGICPGETHSAATHHGIQRAMFRGHFPASSHSGLLTLWEYHMPINPSCQWVYGLFAEKFFRVCGVIDL